MARHITASVHGAAARYSADMSRVRAIVRAAARSNKDIVLSAVGRELNVKFQPVCFTSVMFIKPASFIVQIYHCFKRHHGRQRFRLGKMM
jgi:hypothetical protein